MKTVGIDSHVLYTHYVPATKDHPSGIVTDNGIVIGLEDDKAHIAFLDHFRKPLLGSADWRDAFDRALSIPSEENKGEGHNFYTLAESADEAEIANLRDMLSQSQKTQEQVNKLNEFILENVPGAPFEGETGIETALRLLTSSLTTKATETPKTWGGKASSKKG